MRTLALMLAFGALLGLTGQSALSEEKTKAEALTVVVMDPLAAPLSCPCVQGYAQRDYEQLGKFLETKLGRPVQVAFDESLAVALKKKTNGKADLIIGKWSVVLHDAKESQWPVQPVAALTGKDGATTMTGLIVVPTKDPAKTVSDLKGYKIIFGPAECDEKHAAAVQLLKDAGVPVPDQRATSPSCSDGAVEIIERGPAGRSAAVISSYAAPLLEGCGQVKKGDLRVVGTTAPVPFIGAFVRTSLSDADRDLLTQALFQMGEDAKLLQALETKKGFVAVPTQAAKKK